MPHSQFINMMIIFSVAFVTVLILKVSGPVQSWFCFKHGFRLCSGSGFPIMDYEEAE